MNKMDNGWGVSSAQLFSETVTTVDNGSGIYDGNLAYTGALDANTIIVTYDGTEYTCPSIGEGEYGAPYNDSNPDFSVYPFNLFKDGVYVVLTTQTAGEHTITAAIPTLQTSADFSDAVNSCVQLPRSVLVVNADDQVTDKTWNEINNEFVNGVVCIVSGYGPVLQMWYSTSDSKCYMATGCAGSSNGAFDPMIWRTPGASADLALNQYKHNSQMP